MSVTWTESQAKAHELKLGKVVLPQEPINPLLAIRAEFNPRPSTDEQKLNKLEKAWLRELRSQNFPWIGIQSVTVKLANDCRLTPDFAYLNHDMRLILDDVKGFQREDAFIKMKVAARAFPMFLFQIVTRKNGVWTQKEIKP